MTVGTILSSDPDLALPDFIIPFNQKYEDLAFDGRFLYGGTRGKMDKICLEINGQSTCTVSEPTTFGLLGLGLLGLGISRRKKA